MARIKLSNHGPLPELSDGFTLAPRRTNSAAGPVVRSTEGNKPQSAGPVISWRRATTPRTAISVSTTKTLTTATQPVSEQVTGTGFILYVELEVVCTTAGNSANVTYAADGPYNVLDTVSFADSGGELMNLSGFDLYLVNLYGGTMDNNRLDSGSADTNVYQALTSTGATGGSFRFHLLIPVALNHRNFLGLLGNQDRAQIYQLRSDLSTSATPYGTPPTAAGSVTINRTYVAATVPQAQNAAGVAQQRFPPKFGVQHFVTRTINAAVPVGGATINHFLPRLGNTMRLMILVLKSNGSRATAESNLPSRVQFQLGDTPIFQESVQYRRRLMFQRYGFDAPAGVLVYDWITDLVDFAGDEFGLDWLWTAGIVNAQFQITYPSGFGSTNNSLEVIVSDLIVPDSVDVYAPDGV